MKNNPISTPDNNTDESIAILLSEQNQTTQITKKQRTAWYAMEVVYVAALVFNWTVQNSESWPGYAFRLTQAGAWLAFLQNALHPYSPIRAPLLKASSQCKLGYGRWKCLKDDNYTHSEGFSNLALTVETIIPVLFWALAFREANITKPTSYVDTAIMHGGVTLTILADYFVNNRSFHLLHTLANLALFMGAYTAWNYTGQKVQSGPIYPVIDWEKKPLEAFYVLLIAGASTLAIAGLLKGALYLREGGCKKLSSCSFFTSSRQETSPALGDYRQLDSAA
ncbi:MAG: FAR7a/AIG1-like protein [Gammaproteobacteria bacterium]|jgi:hypothetical protein|nr:FAR7a/AIG1-like protein [Gammaproteobacteria bacterium]